MTFLIFKTKRKKEVVDVTQGIQDKLNELGAGNGICHLFLTHTTAALTTADLDPGTDLDMLDAFQEIIPPHQSKARYGAGEIKYRHPHNPEHAPDHILSSLIGASLLLPVSSGKIVLGTWQRVVLIDFDGPRERRVALAFFEEK